MRIDFYQNLNKLETYSTNKQQIKFNLTNEEDIYISFGKKRKFEFDSRCPRPPKLKGTVAAWISCNRDKKINISFYPISHDLYPQMN